MENPGMLSLLVSFYGYFIPFILMSVWIPLSLIDLLKNEELSGKIGWTFAIILIPLFGAAAYLLLKSKHIQSQIKNAVLYGGFGILVFIFILSNVLKV